MFFSLLVTQVIKLIEEKSRVNPKHNRENLSYIKQRGKYFWNFYKNDYLIIYGSTINNSKLLLYI